MVRKQPPSRPAPRAQVPDGAADIARRFGVTIKTLRLYEDLGLIAPARTSNGWRTYGQADCERLHRVVSLRQLGLSLAAIAELFRKGGQGLSETLELQEQALVEQRAKADEALAIVRRAKARVAAGEALDADALAELVRRVNAARLRWSPGLNEVAARTLGPEVRQRLNQNITPDMEVSWAEVFEDLAALAAIGDPDSAAARAMGRRALALIVKMTGGDHGAWNATAQFWRDSLSRPELARELPMTPKGWDFLGAVITKIRAEEA